MLFIKILKKRQRNATITPTNLEGKATQRIESKNVWKKSQIQEQTSLILKLQLRIHQQKCNTLSRRARTLTRWSDSGSGTAASQSLAQIPSVAGHVVVQHDPRVGEEGTQRWLRGRTHRYTVHIRAGVIALAAGQRLQLLEECVQIPFAAEGRHRSLVTRLAL